MTLNAWTNGLPLAWEVTCVKNMAISNVALSSTEAGKAANAVEQAKVHHYSHLSDRFLFCPVGFETMGTYGSAAKRLVNLVGTRLK